MTAPIASLVGQRVLVRVNDSDPLMTAVRALSPQGQYVWLSQQSTALDCEIGWRHTAFVQVLEVFGPYTLTPTQMQATIAQQGGVTGPAAIVST